MTGYAYGARDDRDLDARVIALGPDARILDVGGSYRPYDLATHVVDLMPYETRADGHYPDRRPGERFSRETWITADVTAPDFRLPFPDGHFDFSLVMQTIEDLPELRPLLRELNRVARAGYIETPSRLAEQTSGISNRGSRFVGYHHHRWIVDREGDGLVFHGKSASEFQPRRHYAVPLRFTERTAGDRDLRFFWTGSIVSRFAQWEESRVAAKAFRAGLPVAMADRIIDPVLRAARRLRDRSRGQWYP